MTSPRPPAEESPDVDPTGMRALLSSLPDPGPMPVDLVERITAALEQQAGKSHASGAPHGAGVVPLHRRHPWRTAFLAAASAAAVLLVAIPLATGTAPGNLSALFGGGSSVAGSAADSRSEERAGQLAQGSSGAAVGAVTVRMTGTAYTRARLAGQARALLASTAPLLYPTAAAEPAPSGPISTPAGMRACADALGIAPEEPIVADVADFDGQPAAVLVVGQAAAPTAYAVSRSCGPAGSALLAGPIPVRP
ncbi:MAG TPA: hypothetical protein VFJ22_08105 [Dermatophilaceae bacterium]|nr:hypothetical protein [Dermatophilaceae bacterium]